MKTPHKPILSPAALGRALRDARRGRRWSQGQLAERAGVAQPTISNVERGQSAVSLSTLLRVLAALELEMVLQARAAPVDLADVWQREGRRG
jgi:HTH-type transcriptional regulator/antitoxin HipB